MSQADRLIATAVKELGYAEKRTNAQLDSPTANAGSANFTKYARDLDALGTFYNGPKNGFAWCDVFVDWCFVETFGAELALKLLCQPQKSTGAGCTYSAQFYKAAGRFVKTPQPGDQIFFTKDGSKTSNHTGIVERVDGVKVYTVEGNTSSAAGVVANGGAVCRKSYALTSASIMGYGRPNWSLVPETRTSRQIVQDAAGLSDGTMDYLAAYRWGKDLLDKLAAAIRIGAVVAAGQGWTSRQLVQAAAGLSDGTMQYLEDYRWGKDLLDKLTAAITKQ